MSGGHWSRTLWMSFKGNIYDGLIRFCKRGSKSREVIIEYEEKSKIFKLKGVKTRTMIL